MMSSNLIQIVLDIKMKSIFIGDHAAISVTFFPVVNQWRLNTSLLKNGKFTSCIKNQILEFFELNLFCAWGRFISLSSAQKRRWEEGKAQLINKLKKTGGAAYG